MVMFQFSVFDYYMVSTYLLEYDLVIKRCVIPGPGHHVDKLPTRPKQTQQIAARGPLRNKDRLPDLGGAKSKAQRSLQISDIFNCWCVYNCISNDMWPYMFLVVKFCIFSRRQLERPYLVITRYERNDHLQPIWLDPSSPFQSVGWWDNFCTLKTGVPGNAKLFLFRFFQLFEVNKNSSSQKKHNLLVVPT